MDDNALMRAVTGIEPLLRGARNAVQSCLGIGRSDTVTIIADESTMAVAAALLAAVEEQGASCQSYILERTSARPIEKLPHMILRAIERSTASIYTAHPLPGEYPHREQLIGLVKPLGLRHAHMVHITEDAMQQGMLSDYPRIAKLNALVIHHLERAREVRVKSRKGTDVRVTIDRGEPWLSSAGIIAPGEWQNLPSGEIATVPSSVDGVFVCDGIIPAEAKADPFELGHHPLWLEIAESRLARISGGPRDLAPLVEETLRGSKDMDRIGMFGVGTNFELLLPIGDTIQDLYMPGAYFAFGRAPFSQDKTWSTSNLLPFSGRGVTLEIDGRPIIRNGRYETSILTETKS